MTPRIIGQDEIESAVAALPPQRVIELIEEGFVAYSEGRAVVPPVAELSFDAPPGDVHVKFGYIRDDPWYVIKIASGFYENAQHGLLVSQGMMLVFDRMTGVPVALLLDNGYLTRVRTAVAGAIAAKYLAPSHVSRIGVVGAGTQARLQLAWLSHVVSARAAVVVARSDERATAFATDMRALGFSVDTATVADLPSSCELIVTTTPAKRPLLAAADVRPGSHVTAIGSDTPDKQELDPSLLARADVIVTDSRSQARERGEIAHALRAGVISEGDVVEIGEVIAGAAGRADDRQTTIADLTGLAVQDIQIAAAVCRHLGIETSRGRRAG